jgi:hypothetical protein
MKRFLCLAVLFLQSMIVLAQQFSSVPGQGRSMVVSKFGIVSTPQFLASQAESGTRYERSHSPRTGESTKSKRPHLAYWPFVALASLSAASVESGWAAKSLRCSAR